jgi:hypothetical protein
VAAIAWATLTTVVTADLALAAAPGMIAEPGFGTDMPKRFFGMCISIGGGRLFVERAGPIADLAGAA